MAKPLRSWHGTRPVAPESKDEGSLVARLERRVFGDEVFVEIQGDHDPNANVRIWIGGTGVNEKFEVSDPQEAHACFDEIVEDLVANGYAGEEDATL